jgi:hypothetical protein
MGILLLTLGLCAIAALFARAARRADYEETVTARLARYAGSNRDLS